MPNAPQAVPPIFIALMFLLASMLKMFKKQYEHAFTRLLIAIWYGVVAAFSIPLDWRVAIGGILFTLLACIEILSYFYRRYIIRQYKNALAPLRDFDPHD